MTDKRRQRRVFSQDFKVQAAKLVLDEGMTRSKVASDLGVSAAQIGKWVLEYQASGVEAFPGNGKLSGKDKKIKELEEENRRLRMERDILKKATAFFAGTGR